MKKNLINIIRGLALYQIFGGILGIGLAIRIIQQLQHLNALSYPLIFLTAAFYVFSIVAGAVLLQHPKRGLTLSLVNQALQVLSIAVSSFAYNYVAGFKLGLGIDFVPAWQFNLNLSLSSFQLILNEATGRVFIGINFLALVLVYVIERLREEI
ncbi:hypothetical protein [Cesiribacter sp. SM1]|uniref:hypothetical protein n=1 Tax=Cesiribacter sp. SM1 TaxID=2861196 RepID=UPI001CD1AD7A|nr:hypothetical protein [Cesiribacter sp. SM1]